MTKSKFLAATLAATLLAATAMPAAAGGRFDGRVSSEPPTFVAAIAAWWSAANLW